MTEYNIAAYVRCPECEEEIPVNFSFFDLNESSHVVSYRCQGCGADVEAEMKIDPMVSTNGGDWDDAEIYHR